jgi:hypothetical protein
VNVATKSSKQKKLRKKIIVVAILKVTNKNIRIRCRIRGSDPESDPESDPLGGGTDPHPYPYQNVTDPQHW